MIIAMLKTSTGRKENIKQFFFNGNVQQQKIQLLWQTSLCNNMFDYTA